MRELYFTRHKETEDGSRILNEFIKKEDYQAKVKEIKEKGWILVEKGKHEV